MAHINSDFSIVLYFSMYNNINLAIYYHKFIGLILVKN